MFAQVLVDIAHANVDRLFTYSIGEDIAIRPGHRVLVPFGAGNKSIEGFVINVTSDLPDGSGGMRIKPVIRAMEPYTALTSEQLELALWMKDAYHCLMVDALRLMIPAQLRGGRVKEKKIRTVVINGGIDINAVLASFMKKNGGVRAPKQKEVVELVMKIGAPVSILDITAHIPGSAASVTALINRGVLVEEDHVTFRDPFSEMEKRATEAPMRLTAAQKQALDSVLAHLDTGGTCLLRGVTGSGKTEVYMQAIAAVLEKGGGAIVLVPEISLTPQAMARFRRRFGDRVAVLHSRLSAGERYDEWRRIRLGMADVVIGARSAVFAPLENIKLIVVDEEHESSYYSEHVPRYGAIEVAARRARQSGAALLLGSATPSVASYLRAKSGKYELLTLPERINRSPMPQVDVVDMRNEFLAGNNSIFSASLYTALSKCLTSGEQAILFMNRRGYSTFVSCRGCGYVMKCPNCDVSMTYHKADNAMKCHYCGKVSRLPAVCPECGKPYIKYFGVGTQQVEEQFKEAFPGFKALRMDLDTTRTRNAHYELLNRFESGEAQVLIGTQMIAKGLDIPNVTLVGVIAADATLHLPDYRSAERTFQLLTQVAGRAGRADKTGHVIIQSYSPDHPVIGFASRHDYEGFYGYEIAMRRSALFPPYSLFLRVQFAGLDELALYDMAENYRKGIEEALLSRLTQTGGNAAQVLFIVAAPSPIRRREGKYRFQVLIKLARTVDTAGLVRTAYAFHDKNAVPEAGNIEINPTDMF